MDRIHPVVRKRHVALVMIRTVALIALVTGTFSILYPIGRGLQLGAAWSDITAIWEWPAWFGVALATLVPGLGLIFMNRSIARWLVPAPRHECPRCAYDLTRHDADRCPECGYHLTT